ncbi:MAG: hypothetical protein E7547_09280 [Ruminococcaceae bacterium]|nr:hypothetical protein [Oscillospiraceae bacterium]
MFKKFVSVISCISLCLNMFLLLAYAENADEISADDFYNQVNLLVEKYDTDDGLASENNPINISNRLIVKNDSNEPLQNYYGASAVVEGYDCLHFLQYSTEEEAKYAYKKFTFEDIEYVEYDFYMNLYTESSVQKSDSHMSWNSSAVQFDEAVDYLTNKNIDCEEIRVAIIDSGVYKGHEFFEVEEGVADRIIDCGYTYDVLMSDENNNDYTVKYPSTEDILFHGTFVAGVIFDNSMENVKIVPFRITNTIKTPYSKILHALSKIIEINTNEMVADDIDVINMSFANTLNIEDKNCYTMIEKLEQASELGVILIAAAGNSNKSTDKILPAAHPKVITVSATNENSAPASFSNYGPSVDISAPGVNITSPTPRMLTDSNDGVFVPYNAYMTDSGTSYSAPIVAAAVAMLKSIDPDITPAEAEKIIKETVYTPEKWEENCNGKNYGTGIVNFYNMVKAVIEPEHSATPIIKLNSDNKFEITVPEGSDLRIYYTLDGTIPDINNHSIYKEPLNLKNKNCSKIIAVCHENGKFIGEPVTYNMIKYDTKTIFYKWSDSLSTENKLKNANWQSYNPNIVSVDSEGNIRGISKGVTRITATLSTGEKIIWKVIVKYSPVQAFFVMFFLGFLWI